MIILLHCDPSTFLHFGSTCHALSTLSTDPSVMSQYWLSIIVSYTSFTRDELQLSLEYVFPLFSPCHHNLLSLTAPYSGHKDYEAYVKRLVRWHRRMGIHSWSLSSSLRRTFFYPVLSYFATLMTTHDRVEFASAADFVGKNLLLLKNSGPFDYRLPTLLSNCYY